MLTSTHSLVASLSLPVCSYRSSALFVSTHHLRCHLLFVLMVFHHLSHLHTLYYSLSRANSVIHDGAPNVGANWVKDAYTQSELVLKSLELAVEFLETGGTFVTKVFRSQDYNALMWVFQQLFARVEATKPQASRNVSAEIFVVCQKFKAPQKVDPKFFDPHYVFEQFEGKGIPDIMQRKEGKNYRAREGYEEGVTLLYKRQSVVEFVMSEEPTQLLTNVNEFIFDDKAKLYTRHPKTTEEIKECFKDIRVLSKKDLRKLLKWRLLMKEWEKQLRKEERRKRKLEAGEDAGSSSSSSTGSLDSNGEPKKKKKKDEEDSAELSENTKLEREVAAIEEEKRKKAKRLKRALNRQKSKYRERVAAAMVLPNDIIEQPEDNSLFSLGGLSTKKGLDKIASTNKDAFDEVDPETLNEDEYIKVDDPEDDLSGSEAEAEYDRVVASQLDSMYERYALKKSDRVRKKNLKSRLEKQMEDEETAKNPATAIPKPKLSEFDVADIETDMAEEQNPLLVKRLGGQAKKSDLWFSNPLFQGALDAEGSDDDMEDISKMASAYRDGKKGANGSLKRKRSGSEDSDDVSAQAGGDDDDEADPFEINDKVEKGELNPEDLKKKKKAKTSKSGRRASWSADDDDAGSNSAEAGEGDEFETVPAYDIDSSDDDSEAPNLMEYYDNERDAEALALGRRLMTEAKQREELIDKSYNRFAFNDNEEILPAWFKEDEEKHNVPEAPVTKDEVEMMKARMMELNARPIKKVAEAMARKKMRTMKRMEKVKSKASTILEQSELSERAKVAALQKLYKGAEHKMRPGSVSVVAKRGKGVVGSKKGKVRTVDARLRSDTRGLKRSAAKAKKFGRKAHTLTGVGKKRRKAMQNAGKTN
eukprot:TRINITY_DN487_c0_g1_i1.p1 TRINITY_DN487_c0_g1~~TRINITY_DN487_c0_g1_i1.p1  ORF type:complete len:873 (-),score=307.39 TRINITY_DN487_c0_g1_i1:131-2749(-)